MNTGFANDGAVYTKRRERGEHGARRRFVDFPRTDAEAIDAATVCDCLAGSIWLDAEILTTLAHFSVSSAMSLPKPAGEPQSQCRLGQQTAPSAWVPEDRSPSRPGSVPRLR
jgi:hypothetical protein